MMNYPRIERLQQWMRDEDLPVAVISHAQNVGYLTGFSGSTAVLLARQDDVLFITDSRYRQQAQKECPGLEILQTEKGVGYAKTYAKVLAEWGLSPIGVEGGHVTVSGFQALEKELKEVECEAELKPFDRIVEPLRTIKDEGEIQTIQHACQLVDDGFEYLLTILKPGITERDVARELEYYLSKQGSEKAAFDTIVASGTRSSMPHGVATDKALEVGDFITFDFGATLDGYHSDITRTVVLGPASERQREVYDVVLRAQLAALEAIKPGMDGKEVDKIARDIIDGAGFADNFGHGLGHGLGRDVHDYGSFSPTQEFKLEAGQVMTVEPGIYIEGWGGCRIEDDVVITEGGCERLTHARKELVEVPV